jgi:paraquat-inducible protein B
MSKKANNLLIGSFVLGAIAIAIVGILVLTAGEFMKDTKQFVLYFDGDLSGLDVGAPLDYKGVKIGKVVDISIVYDYKDDTVSVPVIAEINHDCFTAINGEKVDLIQHGMELHIKRGLRAQLKTQSLVTGKLKITLAYDADAAAPVYRAKNTDLPEIPTIPGSLDSLAKRVSELPLEEIVVDLGNVTKALSKIADSGEVDSFVKSLSNLTRRLEKLPLEDIASEIHDTTKSVAAIIDSGDVRNVLKSLDMTLRESQQLMLRVNKESEPFKDEMLMLMEQFSDAAESIKYLAEYLERHPEALLHGKGKE